MAIGYFRGKPVEKCPKGYTLCKKAMVNNSNCIDTTDCDLRYEKLRKKQLESKKGGKDLSLKVDSKAEKELTNRKKKEKELKEILEMLKSGYIYDPVKKTVTGFVDKDNPGKIINLLKKITDIYPNEVIKGIPGGTEIISFLKVNSQLSSANESTGLLQKFLNNVLGIDVRFGTSDRD